MFSKVHNILELFNYNLSTSWVYWVMSSRYLTS